MDTISLPAPHLILLFVEKSSLCPARPLPQPSTACCCFIIEKSCCDRLREPWWEDGMHLSVHARVSYSRTILIRKQAEQNNKSEQDRASVCLNQQAIFFFFFCCIILSVLGRIWRGMKTKMRVRYAGKIHLEINGSYSQLSRNVKKGCFAAFLNINQRFY